MVTVFFEGLVGLLVVGAGIELLVSLYARFRMKPPTPPTSSDPHE